MKIKYLPLLTLAFGISAWTLKAQDKQPPPPPTDGQMAGDGNGAQQQPPPPPPPQGDTTSGSNAQQPPPPQRPPLPLIVMALANKDGIIDAKAIANAPAILKSLDKNGDGQLTRDEYMGPPPPPPPQDGQNAGNDQSQSQSQSGTSGGQQENQQGQPKHPHRPPMPLIQALDADHNGIIDANEIANATEELLTLDKNGDGQLTPDEYMPKPPKPPKDGHAQGSGQGNQPPPPPPPPPPGGGKGR